MVLYWKVFCGQVFSRQLVWLVVDIQVWWCRQYRVLFSLCWVNMLCSMIMCWWVLVVQWLLGQCLVMMVKLVQVWCGVDRLWWFGFRDYIWCRNIVLWLLLVRLWRQYRQVMLWWVGQVWMKWLMLDIVLLCLLVLYWVQVDLIIVCLVYGLQGYWVIRWWKLVLVLFQLFFFISLWFLLQSCLIGSFLFGFLFLVL